MHLNLFTQTCAGLEQYAIKSFADSLEVIPKTLAENAGVKATEVISKLYAAHQAGDKNAGFDNEVGPGSHIRVDLACKLSKGETQCFKCYTCCLFVVYELLLSLFCFQSGGAAIKDAVKAGILDLYLVKYWALKFATDAAVTVLRVDQVSRHSAYAL